MRRCQKMVNSNRRILTEELLKVQVDAVDTAYIQDELLTMQVAISQIIETLSLSNFDEGTIRKYNQCKER